MLSRRVHLLSTPNVQATAEYYLDVFCGFTRRFAETMHELGWDVHLYAGEESDVPCQELINCFSKKEQADLLGDTAYWRTPYDQTNPLFVMFNARVNAMIQARKAPGDVIACIAGTAHAPVMLQHPELKFLEYSIGYKGVCAPYRVYQSHAWRHVVHGFTGMQYGREYDDVIPHWFHEDEFQTRPTEPYVLFVGRLIAVKGLRTVCEAAKAAGVKLFIIGEGDVSLITYGEYLGHMPPAERNRWMAGAEAVLCPTEYLEPSACVCTEAQLCGTPVIASNWGGFTEYIEDRRSGYLCRSLDEFVSAIGQRGDIDRDYVRARARTLYGWQTGVDAYRRYFARLNSQERVTDATPAMAMA